jgi:hypothetical protein
LRVAHSKVEAATAPGAFGHGVPDLYSLTPQDLLMVFGVVAVGNIQVYAIVNHLLHRIKWSKSEKLATMDSTF